MHYIFHVYFRNKYGDKKIRRGQNFYESLITYNSLCKLKQRKKKKEVPNYLWILINIT